MVDPGIHFNYFMSHQVLGSSHRNSSVSLERLYERFGRFRFKLQSAALSSGNIIKNIIKSIFNTHAEVVFAIL